MKVKRPTRPVDEADWRPHMNQRLRAEFIAGAEEEWRKRTGDRCRPKSSRGLYGRIPGDIYSPPWPEGRRISVALQNAPRPNTNLRRQSSPTTTATARVRKHLTPSLQTHRSRLRIDLQEAQRWCEGWEEFAERSGVTPGPFYWDSAPWVDRRAQWCFEQRNRSPERKRAG